MATTKLKVGTKSRGQYVQVADSQQADGTYTKIDADGKKQELILNAELSAENCGLSDQNTEDQNRDALALVIANGIVNSIAFNNSKGAVFAISGTTNIPAGIDLSFKKGNKISGSGTLSIDPHQIQAGNHQIFDDSITLTCPNDNYKTAKFNPAWLGLTPTDRRGDWYFDPTDTTSDHDGAMVLKTDNGKRLKRMTQRILYPEWWGAVGDNITDDGLAFNNMFEWMETQLAVGSFQVGFLSDSYYTTIPIKIPRTMVSGNKVWLKIIGDGVNIRTDQAIDIFYRIPPDDASVSAYNDNYKLLIDGLNFSGDRSTVGQVGLRISCFYAAVFRNMHLIGLDMGMLGYFMTKPVIDNVIGTVNLSKDIVLNSFQDYPGLTQTHAGTASNAPLIENCRFAKETGSFSAIEIIGSDAPTIRKIIIEGAVPQYGLYLDYGGSTNVNQAVIDDFWFESVGAERGINMRIRWAGVVKISNVQRIYPDILFDFTDCQAYTHIVVDTISEWGNRPDGVFIIADSDTPGMVNRSIDFKNCGNGAYTVLTNPNTWNGSVLPENLSFDSVDYLNGKRFFTANSEIWLLSRMVTPDPYNRNLHIDSNLLWHTDVNAEGTAGGNGGAIGGYYAHPNEVLANNRPAAAFIGRGGFWVDSRAKMSWGRPGYEDEQTDVAMSRYRAGVLQVEANGAIIVPSGTTAEQPADNVSVEGMFRWDKTTKSFMQFDGSVWSGFNANRPPDDYYIPTTPDGSITPSATTVTIAAFAGWRGRMFKNRAKQQLIDTGNFTTDSETVATTPDSYAYDKPTGTYVWNEGAGTDDTFQFEAY